MIRLYLFDEQTLSRLALESFLLRVKGVKLVGQSGSFCQGISLLVKNIPDVLVVNNLAPGPHGLEFIRNAGCLDRAPKILVLSKVNDPVWLRQVVGAGADGYLLKDHDLDDLAFAIHEVMLGKVFYPKLDHKRQLSETLSARECEVLTLIADGHTSKEIGAILKISFRTVDHHRARLMEKLRVNDLQGLTKYAVRCGMIDPCVR